MFLHSDIFIASFYKGAKLPGLQKLCWYQKTVGKQKTKLHTFLGHFGHNHSHLVELDWSNKKD